MQARPRGVEAVQRPRAWHGVAPEVAGMQWERGRRRPLETQSSTN